MGSDRNRPSGRLVALAALCVLIGGGVVAVAIRGGESTTPPDMIVQVVTPPPAPPAPVTAVPANPPEPNSGSEREIAAAAPMGTPGGPRGEPRPRPVALVRPDAEVAIRSAPGGPVVAREDDETEFGSATVFSVDRQRRGWLGVPTPELPNGELGWVRADPEDVAGGYTDYRVTVDLSRHTARLWRGDALLRKWTVTVGAPATPTPTGRFSVTDLFRGGLDPAYGCCAVALTATQPDLPSGWEGGNRIAFHGTAGPLGVDGSSGCIRSADRDVRALVETVPLGTPVTIRR